MIATRADVNVVGDDVLDGLPARSFDWLIRIDRSDLTLNVSGGRVTPHGDLRGFIAGVIHATGDEGHDGVTPLKSDAVLASLAINGVGGFKALRGHFALAVSGLTNGITHVVRDPLGTHPVFYAVTPDAYLFSASARTLLRQPGVSTALNRVAIADHLHKRRPLLHETFFEAVCRLPPGWYASITASGLEARRYWHPIDDNSHAIDFLADEDLERFDGLLDRAVARALTGKQAAIFLSGGFDSVSVAAVARDVADRSACPRPLALSLNFPDPACREGDIQTAVARHLGLSLDLVEFHDAVGSSQLLREALALNAHVDAPLSSPWQPAYRALLERGVRRGVDTVLTGEGGDEWLGTTPYFAADLWRRGDLRGVMQQARTWTRSYRLGWFRAVYAAVWKYGLRPVAGQFAYRVAPAWWDARRARRVIRSMPNWISPDPELRALQYDRARQSLAPADPADGFYGREAHAFLEHSTMASLFEKQFAFCAPLGVRYVAPYWDADLISYMYRVPPSVLNQGDRSKALVRQTVDRRFPGLGFQRHRKVTAATFFTDTVRREGPVIAGAIGDFRGLSSLDLVVPQAARQFLARAWSGSALDLGLAWTLLSVEVWVRRQLGLQ